MSTTLLPIIFLAASACAEVRGVPARTNGQDKDLTAVYAAMNDAPGVAQTVYDRLVTSSIPVSFAYMSPPFAGGPAPLSLSFSDPIEILLNEEVPAEPQAVAPLLAREVAPLLLADLPECAEKSYMRRSYEARAWREMGGSPEGLPVIEAKTGWKDETLAADFKLWLDHDAQTALDMIGAAAGTAKIDDQAAELNKAIETMTPGSPERLEIERRLSRLGRANLEFVLFLINEREWRAAHP